MTKTIQPRHTGAFHIQSVLSFCVSVSAVAIGVAYLPVEAWIRAFLGIGVLYVVTSAFTLAKCVRDRQELTDVTSRVDRARLERLLTEHDPFKPV
ncbi:YiaA/YiaB family inner membrane protein [Streptosporangium saharense]|uniref:YiaA/YiaB family inner membrane protein n=1 Tax=Streptosporangium saharense TaxID=1706840 RepID=UPI0033318CB6